MLKRSEKLIEEIIWAILGIFAGIITGLAPGIHANTIALIALFLQFENRLGIAMFIVSMSITHSIFDAIPSILLGAPSEENSLNILPGHKMLLEGRGLEAINLSAFGSLITIFFSAILALAFFSFAKNYSAFFPLIIPALVTGTILLMIIEEQNKFAAAAVSLCAGIAGMFLLGSGIREPIFVLVTGFFGLPGLLQSLSVKTRIPRQQKMQANANLNLGFVAALTSGLLAVFPGIGPAQAATILKAAYRKISPQEYLVLNGGINTGNLFFSTIMLFALGKTRTGMAAALESTTMPLDTNTALLLSATALMAAGFCAAVIGSFASASLNILQKLDYKKVTACTLVFIVALIYYFSGPLGLLACSVCTGISLYALGSKVRRSHCMSFLLFPTLAFYLGFG